MVKWPCGCTLVAFANASCTSRLWSLQPGAFTSCPPSFTGYSPFRLDGKSEPSPLYNKTDGVKTHLPAPNHTQHRAPARLRRHGRSPTSWCKVERVNLFETLCMQKKYNWKAKRSRSWRDLKKCTDFRKVQMTKGEVNTGSGERVSSCLSQWCSEEDKQDSTKDIVTNCSF